MIMWRVGILVASMAATASAGTFDNQGNGTCAFYGTIKHYTLGFLQKNNMTNNGVNCEELCFSDNRCVAYTVDDKKNTCKKHGNYVTFEKFDNDKFKFVQGMSQQGMTNNYMAPMIKGQGEDSTRSCHVRKPNADPPKASAHRHVVGSGVAVLLVGVSLLVAE